MHCRVLRSICGQVEKNEHALDDIIGLAEENRANRLKLKEGGLMPLVLGLWQRHSKLGTHLRSRALTALRSMAVDSLENKVSIVANFVVVLIQID